VAGGWVEYRAPGAAGYWMVWEIGWRSGFAGTAAMPMWCSRSGTVARSQVAPRSAPQHAMTRDRGAAYP